MFFVARAQEAQTPGASNPVMSVSAYLLNAENEEVPNGEYEVRFSIYSRDRAELDPFPSDADAGARVWEETQTVVVYNGVMNALLGSVVPFPETLIFDEGEYYLGIRIAEDAEIAPRKRLSAVPAAFNARSAELLAGRKIGTEEGDILTVGEGGLLDESLLPAITRLATVSQGVWEGDVIENDFLTDAFTDKTYNGLILAKTGNGFTIEGGSTLTISGNAQLNQDLTTDASPQFAGVGLSSESAPSSPKAGAIYSDGTNLYFYNGSVWEDLTLASAGGNVSGSGVAGRLTYWTGDLTLASATLTGGSGIEITSTAEEFSVGLDLTNAGEDPVTTKEASQSGLELTSNGLQLLGGCNDGQVLAWDDALSVWACSNKTAGTSDWTTSGGVITYLTDTDDDFAIGGNTASGAIFGVDRTDARFYFASDNEFSPNPTLNFTSAGGATGSIAFTNQGSFQILSGSATFGNGVLVPRLSLAGGDANQPPLVIGTSVSLLSTGQPGAIESDGDHLYFTRSDGTRQFLAMEGDVTGAAHNRVSLSTSSSYDYLSLDEDDQVLTLNAIDLAGDVDGVLPLVSGGTGLNVENPASGSILLGTGSGYDLYALAGGNGASFAIDAQSKTATLSTTLGGQIDDTTEIKDGLILPQHLFSNAPAHQDVLTYKVDADTGNISFQWVNLTSTGAAGDILAVGDVESGLAFTNKEGGTGTSLWFHSGTNTGLLTVGNLPTQDRTYTLPNATGTILVAGDFGNLGTINKVGTIGEGIWQGTAIANGHVADDLTINGGTISNSTITLSTTVNSAEGRIAWDATNNRIVVGNGSELTTTKFYGSSDGSGILTDSVVIWGEGQELSGEAHLATSRGGTGIGSYTAGQMLYANNATPTPTLSALNLGEPGSLLVAGNDAPAWGALDLSSEFAVGTSVLGVANGGTGVDASTILDGQILIGDDSANGFELTYLGGGTGVVITNSAGGVSIGLNLADLIGTDEINDGTILPKDLNVNNQILGSDPDGMVLTYNAGKFNWVDPASGGTSGIGDISGVGDVGTGKAFTNDSGATGTSLWFHDKTDQDNPLYGLLKLETTEGQPGKLSANRTYILPNTSGVLATTDYVGNASHPAVNFASGSADYISLDALNQTITASKIDLSDNVTETLGITNGGTGLALSLPSGFLQSGQIPMSFAGESAFTLGSISSPDTVGNYGAITVNTANQGSISLSIKLPSVNVENSTTSSRSGLEKTSNGLHLLGGCNDKEVLEWSETNKVWQCSSKTAGNSDWSRENNSQGTITFLTQGTDDFAIGGKSYDSSVFGIDTSSATFYIGSNGASDPSLIFANSTGATGSLGFGTNKIFSLDGGLTIGAGSATRAPLKLASGTSLTTEQEGAFEYDGTNLYFTRDASEGRKTIAYTDDIGQGHSEVSLVSAPYDPPLTMGYLQLEGQQITMNKVNINAETAGTLGVTRGGTGVETLEAGGVLVGNGTSAVTTKKATTAWQLFMANDFQTPVFRTLDANSDVAFDASGNLLVGADKITLGTDTNGNYVASVSTGNGLTGGLTGGEGTNPSLALGNLTDDWMQTGDGDIVLANANSNLKILENGTGGTHYGTFDVATLDVDRTYTFPNASGYVALRSGDSPAEDQLAVWSGAYTLEGIDALPIKQGGTGLIDPLVGGGNLLIGKADGTFNLADLTSGTGIKIIEDGSVGTITIGVDQTAVDLVDSTMIKDEGIKEVDLLTGAGAPQDKYVLTYNEASKGFSWQSPTTVGQTGDITGVGNEGSGDVFHEGTDRSHSLWFYDGTHGTYRGKLTSVGSGLTDHRTYTLPNATGTILVAGEYGNLNAINKVGTIGEGIWQGTAIANGHVADDLTINGGTISNSAITLSTTEDTAEGRVAWNAGGDYLSIGNGNGGQAIFTPLSASGAQNQVAYWSASGTLSGENTLATLRGGTGISTYTRGDILFGNASNGLSKLSAGTSGRVLITQGTTGDPIWGQVSLTAGVSGTLPLANGGTNASLTASNGGIVYSTDSALAILDGTSVAGRALVSGASGTPSWFAPTAGSLIFAGASGALSQSNTSLFWDNTNSRLGIGTNTPEAMLSLFGANNKLRLGHDATNYVDISRTSSATLRIEGDPTYSSAPIIRLGNNTAQDASVQFDGSGATDVYAGLDESGKFMIGTGTGVGSNAQLTIDSTGRVGIGTTTPGQKFAVAGLISESSGFPSVVIDSITGNFYISGSTRDIKDNIHIFDEDYMRILDLDVKEFTDKTTGSTAIGLIAEELDEAGFERLVNYGAEGKVEGIKYDRISLYLLEVAKGQRDEIVSIQDDVDDLRKDVDSLKSLASVESQIQAIREESSALTDFFASIDPDLFVTRDALGGVNLGTGKLEASGVVAGAFTVRVADESARTIGTASVEARELGDPDVVTESSNEEGDSGVVTGYRYAVEVPTTAITNRSKVFVTSKAPIDTPMGVSKKTSGEGFTVNIKVSEKLEDNDEVIFDWVIVEEEGE